MGIMITPRTLFISFSVISRETFSNQHADKTENKSSTNWQAQPNQLSDCWNYPDNDQDEEDVNGLNSESLYVELP